MLFVFGTKDDARQRGFVVDRCAECRALRWLKVIDRYTVWHLYFVPIGRGSLEASVCECTRCGTTLTLDAERYSEVLPNKVDRPLDEVVAETTPELARQLARLARLEQIRNEPAYRSIGDAGPDDLLSTAVQRLRALELGGVDSGPWLARLERWPRLSPNERELLAAELGGYARAMGVG
jgi:hypothetical protein